jgi:diguanylate cyclase (GGDEF)-like protein
MPAVLPEKKTEPHVETLLIVDDDPNIHPLIDLHLEGVVERILHADSARLGLQIARESRPDVVLLDIDMPQMDGYAVCRALKSDEDTQDSQILFLTAECEEHLIAKALDLGGADYVSKPFNVIVLQARVRSALRTKRLIDLLTKEARIDGLTGLPNRRVFEQTLARQCSEFRRQPENFAVAILDLDHFKAINDTFGHGVGDEVLRRVGKAIHDTQRAYELVCRIGGEEFAVLLRGVDAEGAVHAVDRILDAIRMVKVSARDQWVNVTASAGIANTSVGDTVVEATRVLKIADTALYSAKAGGRDRVVSGMVEKGPGQEP